MKGLGLNNALLGCLLLVAVFGVGFCMIAEAARLRDKSKLETDVESLKQDMATQREWDNTLDAILTDAGYPTKALPKWKKK